MITDRLVLDNHTQISLNHQITIGIDRHSENAIVLHPDQRGVGTGADHEVVFHVGVIAEVPQVNPRIDVGVSHVGEAGDICLPFHRVIANEIIVLFVGNPSGHGHRLGI